DYYCAIWHSRAYIF
nr:immunoglobulin light chain junction region [Macaca mulatta]MOW02405.1 immunoglobulin light chain junction region [Macaca mulatta]MOW02526.1 immunoglobulin light chain junction region [Macaca mulatta]MOW02999.1 immunoglobulin light chain junction region [Macaca mulatta]MOW03047.1 immunoglobulin light chain junction region [Macaca mulatta]